MRAKVEALQSQSSFKKAFSATDRAESLAGLQDTIKAALEEMQVSALGTIAVRSSDLCHRERHQLLVGLNTVDLLTELCQLPNIHTPTFSNDFVQTTPTRAKKPVAFLIVWVMPIMVREATR